MATDFLNLKGYDIDNTTYNFTQDILGIKSIKNGIIKTVDNRHVKILEVVPINFFTRTAREQDAIVRDFMSWLSIAPIKMQIKIVCETDDQENYIRNMMSRIERENDLAVKNHVISYAKLLKRLGSNMAVTRKFYLIYEYEPKSAMDRLTDDDEIANLMYDIYFQIKNGFSRMGNSVFLLSDSTNLTVEDWRTGELLYKLLNPRTRLKHSLSKRIKRVNNDIDCINKKEMKLFDFPSYVAPLKLDFSHKKFYILDGKYYTTIAISSNGYPTGAYAGWLSSLANLDAGESLDFYLRKESPAKMKNTIARRLKFSQVELMDKNETQVDYEKTESAVNAAYYMKNAMANNELPFYMSTLITISSDTFEGLTKRKDKIIESIIMRGLDINDLEYKQEYAFRSTLPLNYIHPKIEKEVERNIMSSGVAASYPFTSYEMKDENGFFFGINMYNSSLSFLNPFNQRRYTNANMAILGTSGAGKTYTEQLIALRLRELGNQVFILAPYKAHEYKRACKSVEGSFIKISSDSKDYINLMDIRPISSKTNELLQGEDASENTIWLSDKAKTIITFCSLLMPDMKPEEEQRLDTAIMETYKRFGITQDNDSLYKDKDNKEKGLKKMPIIEDLYNTLKETTGCERIVTALSQFVSGSLQSFNKQTNVDLKNKYIVFDVEHLDKRFISAGMFLVLDFLMGRIKEDVLERKMVFIDEGWKLIGSGANIKAAEYVQSIFKVIRGYNGGACIATQDIGDFFSLDNGKYGNAILSNSKIKILLKMEQTEADYVGKLLNLTYEETRNLTKYERGNCLFCANNDHVEISVTGSNYLSKLVTTNPDEVKYVTDEIEKYGHVLPD